MAKLYTLLKASETQMRKILNKELKANGYTPLMNDDFIYAEGSIPVLLVGHYDTIPDAPRYIQNKDGVLSAKKGLGADDRAGIYGILELIKNHHCHVLFTGGEESGCIGAKAFTKSGIKPDVNYIIELDRRGTNDSVYYQGDNKEFEDFINSFGWKTAIGSCTDICQVAPYLDVMGVNLSIGYQNEHTENETLDTNIMNKNIERVSKMFEGQKFVWKERAYKYTGLDYMYSGYYGYDYYDDDSMWYIEYITENGDSAGAFVYGFSEPEAIGNFLMEHEELRFVDILDLYPADEAPKDTITESVLKGDYDYEQDTNIIYN